MLLSLKTIDPFYTIWLLNKTKTIFNLNNNLRRKKQKFEKVFSKNFFNLNFFYIGLYGTSFNNYVNKIKLNNFVFLTNFIYNSFRYNFLFKNLLNQKNILIFFFNQSNFLNNFINKKIISKRNVYNFLN